MAFVSVVDSLAMTHLTTLHQTRQRLIAKASNQKGQSGVTETRRRLYITTHELMEKEKEMKMNKSDVLGALERGYCADGNTHKTLDSDLCEAQADEVMNLINPTAIYMHFLGEVMRSDDDYRNGWHASLSMMMQDSGVSQSEANDRADSFLRMAFNA